MTPISYSIDSQSKSADLAGKIIAADAPPEIAAAVKALESHLQKHSPDQNRYFFSITFPTLICKFFGFDDAASSQKPPSCHGWIDIVASANDSELAGKVFDLFSPTGVLMSSISAVDRLYLVKYVFPVERLPEWVRFMLSNEQDCQILSDLCPLFKGRIKGDQIKGNYQVQLNVFEYYMFWFAYYPVCRGNGENSSVVNYRRSSKFRLANWTSSIPVLSGSTKRGPEQKCDCNLYLRLLYAYLRAFVPMDDVNVHQSHRSSLLHYSTSYDGIVRLRAEFLVNTLIHFWLVDNDFSPLPVNLCKSFGVSFPFRTVLGETPPVSGLGEVVKLFAKYLNLSSVMISEAFNHVEYAHVGSPIYRKLGSGDVVRSEEVIPLLSSLPSAGAWNSSIQRPVYRFILRTFLFCPTGSSMKNISEVFYVWVSYIEPWKLSKEEFAELDTMSDSSKKSEGQDSGQSDQLKYSPIWKGYVLSNYLFYHSMVLHFIGFAHKFLHTDAEMIVRLVLKVLNILTSSQELLDLIRNVDTVFHSKHASSGKSVLNSLHKYVPQIREQLEDWEDGLSESDTDGSFLHENRIKDLRLFSDAEDGGQQLLQLFILRAESELQAISGDNLASYLQLIDSLKAQYRALFGDNAVKPSPAPLEPRPEMKPRDDLFRPRKVSNSSVGDVKYKGDWMRRPISNNEVAWLAKLLIELSSWLNESLVLCQQDGSHTSPAWSYVNVPSNEINECGMSDTLQDVSSAVASWFFTLRSVIAKLMIKHGLRVNLRMLASKKLVTMLALFVVFSVMRRVFRSVS